MVQLSCENQVLRLGLEGRIDSSNAGAAEKEIADFAGSHPQSSVVIDAEKLEYISSAGLRVILRIRKGDPELRILNVSSEVYEILEMTGFTEMMPVEKAYRRFSVEGCEVLGEGSNGVVYRYDPDTVVKVYRNPDALPEIRRERELARKALILGIPTAIPYDVVRVGEGYGSVFELLNAKSFSKLIAAEPEKLDLYVEQFVDLLKKIHSTEVSPEDMTDMKAVALDWAAFLQEYLPADQGEKLKNLIQAVPERHTMIHGDYHTNNVEVQDGEVLLIDMDTLSFGHPVFELASMYLGFVGFGEMNRESAEKFMKLSYETMCRIWKKSLSLYLGTEDPEEISRVEKKAMVVGYARLMRRTIRRMGQDSPEGSTIVAKCREHLAELLGEVDSLEF